jgi:large subunit ribosomal protein L1
MKTLSKRAKLNQEKIDETKLYTPQEAVTLLKETATAKFIEAAETHITLNVNPKYADQQVRSTVVLPHGNGKSIKIAALIANTSSSDNDYGADIIGSEDLIEDINKGNVNFDLLIAEPSMMPKLAKLGKVLGPRGLMPSPKAGTVTANVKEAVSEFKKGKLEYKVDKTGILHINFGKVDFSPENLLENLETLYRSIVQNKPAGVKGKYLKNIYICSTMGPSIEIDASLF